MKRRMLGSAVLGLGTALLVAGCGAGQITQTDTQAAAINGASAEVKDIAIRNAELAYPEDVQPAAYLEGSDAEVLMSIVNRSGRNDELVSVSSDAATNVSVQGDRAVPAGTALAIGPNEPGAGKQLHGEIVLEGLKREIRPGQTVIATLTFRDAGPVDVELPVMAPSEPRVAEEGHGEGGH
ncbi:copper chaperone PCu(A)C [Prauserella flavalba]|nr:copper chaperone PCu(A)C [Prauserella flavalba]